MRLGSALAVTVLGPGLGLAGCLAQGEGLLQPRPGEEDAGPPPLTFLDGAGAPGPAPDASLPEAPPHSLRGVEPSHGPFAGGQRAILRGTGFGTDVRVWFGEHEVPATDVLPVDPERIQVMVPAGHAGTVDVTAQNGDDESTRVSLPDGYVYDPFYVAPSSGPVSGGTIITIHGDGTGWDAATEALVDGKPCEFVALRTAESTQELECRTPPGTPGAKRVTVSSAGRRDDVLDAFVYGDSDNGFRGGLSGQTLDGKLRAVVLNSYTGRAIPGAIVVIGSEATGDAVHEADANGVVIVEAPDLGPTVTVTIAGECFMPTTFVDVPVDTVTAYLEPLLSPTCLDNGRFTGVGPGGGSSRAGATIEGEIVFQGTLEFRRANWDVPPPKSDDVKRAAYVFELGRDLSQKFRLPAEADQVTPESTGRRGYAFSSTSSVGSVTLYALAGLEDRRPNPPVFTAYTLGIASGIGTEPSGTTEEVFIEMNIPLDHAVALEVAGPTPTSRGPDRVEASVGVRLGTLGYVILPIGAKTGLLPATEPLNFVGIPPLIEGLAGAEYVMTAQAFTGESRSQPKSVLGRFATTTPSGALRLEGFLEIPRLEEPGPNGAWNGRDLAITTAPGGPEADLTVFEIGSGNGLSTWTIAAPRGTTAVRLPDLSQLGPLGVEPGPITIEISRARIDAFVYGSLRYADLASRGWDAYATDVVQAHY